MKVGFAGSGNMAAAIARGWARTEPAPELMLFADSGSGRARELAAEVGGSAVGSVAELAAGSDVVILAVKPQVLEEVAAPLAGNVAGVVSVLGATPLARLRAALGGTPVVRTMPNLAVEVGRGIVCHTSIEGEPELAEALALLGSIATLVELDEGHLDAATAVMGCAPAYLALASEALIEAGIEAGLPAEVSDRLVREAAAGLGAHQLDRHPADLQRAIASPGGSTEAGLVALREAGAPEAFRGAVVASLDRMAGRA